MSLAPEPSVCSKAQSGSEARPRWGFSRPRWGFPRWPPLGVPSPPLGIPSLTARSLAPAGVPSLAARSPLGRPRWGFLAGRSVAARSYHQHSLESRAMRVECRRIRLQRRRHPNTPNAPPDGMSAQRGPETVDITLQPKAGDQNLDQAGARPTSARQTGIERGITCRQHLRPSGDRAVSEGTPAGASEGIPSGGARAALRPRQMAGCSSNRASSVTERSATERSARESPAGRSATVATWGSQSTMQ